MGEMVFVIERMQWESLTGHLIFGIILGVMAPKTLKSAADAEPSERTSTPAKRDRDEIFIEYTKSICPICFAESGHQSDGYSITREQRAKMLDVFVASEGEAEVVMLSGDEPTIHKHLLEFVDKALERPIHAVNVNTNGIRLASDKGFVAALGERNRAHPGKRVHIYLQFDGFERDTHLQVRNRDLREIKQRALDNCA